MHTSTFAEFFSLALLGPVAAQEAMDQKTFVEILSAEMQGIVVSQDGKLDGVQKDLAYRFAHVEGNQQEGGGNMLRSEPPAGVEGPTAFIQETDPKKNDKLCYTVMNVPGYVPLPEEGYWKFYESYCTKHADSYAHLKVDQEDLKDKVMEVYYLDAPVESTAASAFDNSFAGIGLRMLDPKLKTNAEKYRVDLQYWPAVMEQASAPLRSPAGSLDMMEKHMQWKNRAVVTSVVTKNAWSTDWHRAALLGRSDNPARYNELLDFARDWALTHPYYQELHVVDAMTNKTVMEPKNAFSFVQEIVDRAGLDMAGEDAFSEVKAKSPVLKVTDAHVCRVPDHPQPWWTEEPPRGEGQDEMWQAEREKAWAMYPSMNETDDEITAPFTDDMLGLGIFSNLAHGSTGENARFFSRVARKGTWAVPLRYEKETVAIPTRELQCDVPTWYMCMKTDSVHSEENPNGNGGNTANFIDAIPNPKISDIVDKVPGSAPKINGLENLLDFGPNKAISLFLKEIGKKAVGKEQLLNAGGAKNSKAADMGLDLKLLADSLVAAVTLATESLPDPYEAPKYDPFQ